MAEFDSLIVGAGLHGSIFDREATNGSRRVLSFDNLPLALADCLSWVKEFAL